MTTPLPALPPAAHTLRLCLMRAANTYLDRRDRAARSTEAKQAFENAYARDGVHWIVVHDPDDAFAHFTPEAKSDLAARLRTVRGLDVHLFRKGDVAVMRVL